MEIINMNICNINKTISKNHILKNISFSCKQNEITGVIGENGSGKSSLFKVLSGLWNIDSGNIRINHKDYFENKQSIVKDIGSFIEGPNLYYDLSARENFKIMLDLHNVKDLDWYNYLISQFEVKNYLDKKVKKYSLGMQQKAGLIMSLINDPKIIILDEPTNSLDVKSVKVLHDILKSRKKEKLILISSHILEELDSIADKTLLIHNGEVRSTYLKDNEQQYIIKFNKDITDEELYKLTSLKSFSRLDSRSANIECSNITSLLKESSKLSLEIVFFKDASNLKNFYNKNVGDNNE